MLSWFSVFFSLNLVSIFKKLIQFDHFVKFFKVDERFFIKIDIRIMLIILTK